MAKLPTDLSGREVRTALERGGFVFRRQTGSHMILRRDEPHARAVIADHKHGCAAVEIWRPVSLNSNSGMAKGTRVELEGFGGIYA